MSALVQEIEAIAARVFERILAAEEVNKGTPAMPPDAVELRCRLALINAKERISIGEAALLLNCSDGHLRNLIGKARKGQSRQPIPFTDLDGVTVFERLALLEWANTPKHKLKAIGERELASRVTSQDKAS